MAHGRLWTEEEDGFIIANQKNMTYKQIAKEIDRTAPAVSYRVNALGIRGSRPHNWTDEETAYLEKHWHRKKIKKIAKKLNRTETAVLLKAKRLKLGPQQNPKRWTAHEISKALNVDIHTVIRWIERGCIKAPLAPLEEMKVYQITSEELIRFLKENPKEWDSRRAPDIHIEIKRKEMNGPKHWKHWGQKKNNRIMPENLRGAFVDFVVSVAKEAKDRIAEAKQPPDWLKEKMGADQELAENRFAHWKPKEDKELMKYLHGTYMTYSEIGEKMGRSENSIAHRARRVIHGRL